MDRRPLLNVRPWDTVGHSTSAIDKLRRALDVTPGDLLEIIDDPPKPKRRTKKKKR